MEFRWLTEEEKRTRMLESRSLSEVLALAQKLQAEGEGLVTEAQVLEVGRELGIRPEYVREALLLRQRATQPEQVLAPAPDRSATDHNPLNAVAYAILMVFALAMFPPAISALQETWMGPLAFWAFLVAFITGWTARYPRLASTAGALAVPLVLLIAGIYGSFHHLAPFAYGPSAEAVFLSLLSFCPLCATAGRAASTVRRWIERFGQHVRPAVPGH